MSKQSDELSIRRILVALDASSHSLAALEVAVNLAELLQAELVGIFVEDINLVRVAQLPFVREIRFPAAQIYDINEEQMQEQLRAQAAQAQREISELADEKHVRYSFQVVRGPVTAKLLAAALEADLLALGRLGRSLAPQSRLGSTARTAVAQAKGPVLLMRAGVDLSQPVLALYDGTPAARRALSVAAVLAQNSGHLRVLIWTDDNDSARDYKRDIVTQLHEAAIEISYRRFFPAEKDKLVEVVGKSKVGLLVLGVTDSELPEETIQALLEELDDPVLVVR